MLVTGDFLAAQVERVGSEQLGELVLVDEAGAELIRITSMRARARNARWGRDDLFLVERSVARGVRPIGEDVDVEAYLGGWS